jgi:hypothetical protein
LKQAGKKKKKISKSFSYTKLRDTRQTPTKQQNQHLPRKNKAPYTAGRERDNRATPRKSLPRPTQHNLIFLYRRNSSSSSQGNYSQTRNKQWNAFLLLLLFFFFNKSNCYSQSCY